MPIGNPLQDILGVSFPAGYKQAAELEKQQIENQFAPAVNMANVASKRTYAQYLPAQILGQVLANPLAWQSMSKEQLNDLTQRYANALKNPPSLESMSRMPGAKNGLLSMLMNKLSDSEVQGQKQEPQNALMSPPSAMDRAQAGHDQFNNLPVGNISGEQTGSQPASTGGLPSTTINRLAPGMQVGGFGGVNPLTTAKAQAAGLETTATSEAGNQAAQWKDMISSAVEGAQSAQNVINLLDKAEEAYPLLKKWEKGPVGGNLPAFTTAASDVDKATSGIADAVARATQQGHITQGDRVTYKGIKAERGQPGESFKHQVDYMRGMNERIQEYPAFIQRAQEAGLNPAQAGAVWTYYINQRPFYNAKNNKINDKNLNSWEEFLTPKKFQEAMNPSLRPKSSKNDNEIVNVRKPDGGIISLPRSGAERLVKDHPKHQIVNG